MEEQSYFINALFFFAPKLVCPRDDRRVTKPAGHRQKTIQSKAAAAKANISAKVCFLLACSIGHCRFSKHLRQCVSVIRQINLRIANHQRRQTV